MQSKIRLFLKAQLSLALMLLLSYGSQAQADGRQFMKHFPQDSLVFVGVAGLNDLKEDSKITPFGKFAASERMAPLRAECNRIVKMLLGKVEQDAQAAKLANVVVPLMNNGFCLGVSRMGSGPSGPIPLISFISPLGADSAKFQIEFIELLKSVEEVEVGKAVLEGTLTYQPLRMPSFPPTLYIGNKAGHLLLSLDLGFMRSFSAEKAEADGLGELASLKDFCQDNVEGGAVSAIGYFNFKTIFTLAEQFIAMAQGPWAQPVEKMIQEYKVREIESLSFVHGLSSEGTRMGFRVTGPSLPNKRPAINKEDLAIVAPGALYALGTTNFLPELCRLADAISYQDKNLRSGWEMILQQFEQMNKTSLSSFVKAIGTQITVFEEPGMRGLGPIVCFKGADSANFEKIPSTLLAALSRGKVSGPLVSKALSCVGQQIQYIEVDPKLLVELDLQANPLVLSWVNIGDDLYLSLHPSILEQMLVRKSRTRDSLFSSKAFARVRSSWPSKTQAFYYVDSPELVKIVYPLLPSATSALLGGIRQGAGFDTNLTIGMIPAMQHFENTLRPEFSFSLIEEDAWSLQGSSSLLCSGIQATAIAAVIGLGANQRVVALPRARLLESPQDFKTTEIHAIYQLAAMIEIYEVRKGQVANSVEELLGPGPYAGKDFEWKSRARIIPSSEKPNEKSISFYIVSTDGKEVRYTINSGDDFEVGVAEFNRLLTKQGVTEKVAL